MCYQVIQRILIYFATPNAPELKPQKRTTASTPSTGQTDLLLNATGSLEAPSMQVHQPGHQQSELLQSRLLQPWLTQGQALIAAKRRLSKDFVKMKYIWLRWLVLFPMLVACGSSIGWHDLSRGHCHRHYYDFVSGGGATPLSASSPTAPWSKLPFLIKFSGFSPSQKSEPGQVWKGHSGKDS